MKEFLPQFLIESRELVEQATEDLLALEQAPDDHPRLDSAFRAFHTLKGAAGIMDFAAMGRLLHAAEDALSQVRGGRRAVTVDLVGLCLSALDQVVQWLEHMEETGEAPGDAGASADRLADRFGAGEAEGPAPIGASDGAGGPPPWLGSLLDLHPGPAAATALRYTPDAGCFFRGEDPLALIERVPGLVGLRLSPARPWPDLDGLDPFACNLVVDALFSVELEVVAAHLRTVRDQVQLHAVGSAAASEALSDAARAVLQAQIDLVLECEGEGFAGKLGSAGRVAAAVLGQAGLDPAPIARALAASLAASDPSAFADALRAVLEPSRTAGAPQVQAEPMAPNAAVRALRVDVDRIDAIIKLTGELTVVKNALGHVAGLARANGDALALAQALKAQHGQLERLTAELQRSVIAIRVLPLRHVFQRFSRLVREMAGALGKSARLVVEGEATEADKAVVEALFDPLLHVVRNALGHGVEDADARREAGKPQTALIRLRGFREGEQVIVEVGDDGRGIDPARIRGVASEIGLLSPDALATMSDKDVIELIFAPGFSTAGVVTDLSGRGVGMDAVRTAVERLGGRVAVRSRPGEGTTVRFVLPFTVMMTRVMIVEAAGQAFGVPFEAVVETLQLARGDISPIGAAEAFVLRGRTVPLISLSRALGLPPAGARPARTKAVVTAAGGQLSALEVDRFGERLDVMLKPMDGLLAGLRGVAGTTLLGDGRVLIVLDLEALLQ
jgi:two-component system chemotaxis sensor kinase CheA